MTTPTEMTLTRLTIPDVQARLAVGRTTVGEWNRAGKSLRPPDLNDHRLWLHGIEEWEREDTSPPR